MTDPLELDFSSFGHMGCLDSSDEEPITAPMPGTANLVVEDKCIPLFITAEWTIIAKVGQHELGRSTTSVKAHTGPFVERWTRQLIRQNKARLVRLGVDVEATYVQHGGLLKDLDD